jgi:hypothetical protein
MILLKNRSVFYSFLNLISICQKKADPSFWNIILTGDCDLLEIGKFFGTEIVDLNEFLLG